MPMHTPGEVLKNLGVGAQLNFGMGAKPFFSKTLEELAMPKQDKSFLAKLFSTKTGPKFDKFLQLLQNPEILNLLNGRQFQAPPVSGPQGGLLGRII